MDTEAGWVALSDAEQAMPGEAEGGALASGTFVAEFSLPGGGAAVLLDHKAGRGAEEWGFSIFIDLAGAIALRHRRGSVLQRHLLRAPVALPSCGILRLVWTWDHAPRRWTLRLDQAAGGTLAVAQGDRAMAVPLPALSRMCRAGGATLRHPALLWFGATRAPVEPPARPWIGPQTPIETPAGPVRAASLGQGDTVLTTAGPARVTGILRTCLPARGSHAPVLLRAPYFGSACDLLVSPDQPVLFAGTAVEYLFGDDAVLAEARHLVDGRSALSDTRRAVVQGITLHLDVPGVILADGCGLPVAPVPPAQRRLVAHEAVTLLAHPGRSARLNAA